MKLRYYVHQHDCSTDLDYVEDSLEKIEANHQAWEECRNLYSRPIKGYEIDFEKASLADVMNSGRRHCEIAPEWESYEPITTHGVTRIL